MVSTSVTQTKVLDLIRSAEDGFSLRLLTSLDPGRVASLVDFKTFFSDRRPTTVAVVSGSAGEPELSLLSSNFSLSILDFESNPSLFDLNADWSLPEWDEYHSVFDLVLCEQVLEHVLHPQRAIQNLALLLRPGGILHVSVPSVNNYHGEPDYFYSGFAVETIQKWAQATGLEVRHSGSFYSDKASRMYSTGQWSTLATSGPFVFFRMALRLFWNQPRRLKKLFKKRIVNWMTYPMQPLFPREGTRNAVVSWVFAVKPR